MKPLKVGLRIWFVLVSLLSFLGGWILFSRSGKPAPLSAPAQSVQAGLSAAPAAALEPVPSLDSLSGGSLQPLPSLPSLRANQAAPRLRTRGS